MKVIIDTNALIIPHKFKIDIFEEIEKLLPTAEKIIIDSTIRELHNIKDRKAANIALQLINKYNIKIVHEPGETDSAIITYAQTNNGVVFTNDKEMKKMCIRFKVPVMYMRKKKKIELEGL